MWEEGGFSCGGWLRRGLRARTAEELRQLQPIAAELPRGLQQGSQSGGGFSAGTIHPLLPTSSLDVIADHAAIYEISGISIKKNLSSEFSKKS